MIKKIKLVEFLDFANLLANKKGMIQVTANTPEYTVIPCHRVKFAAGHKRVELMLNYGLEKLVAELEVECLVYILPMP